MREFSAVIFDMDGIIFDSERVVIECWKEIAEKYDIKDIEASCIKCTGTNSQRTKEIMHEIYGEYFPYDEYAAEASRMFHEKYDIPQNDKEFEYLCRYHSAGCMAILGKWVLEGYSHSKESVVKAIDDRIAVLQGFVM